MFKYLHQIFKSYSYLFEHWKHEGLGRYICVSGFEEPNKLRGSSR